MNRETYEWNEEHIPYALYTGRGCLERDVEGIVPDVQDEIVVYCVGFELCTCQKMTGILIKCVSLLLGWRKQISFSW